MVTVPSGGVWRMEFCTRFWSTRTSRGEHAASPAPSRSVRTATPFSVASTSQAARTDPTTSSTRARSVSASMAPASSWTSSNRSSTSATSASTERRISPAYRRRVGGSSTTPSSIASTMARTRASGQLATSESAGGGGETLHGSGGAPGQHERGAHAGSHRVGEHHHHCGHVVPADEHEPGHHGQVGQPDQERHDRDGGETEPDGDACKQAPSGGHRSDRGDGRRQQEQCEVPELVAVHAGPRSHEDGDAGARGRCGGHHDEPSGSVHGSNRYPTPHTVTRWRGAEGSSSIFSRRRRTWTVTVEGSPSNAKSHSSSRR